MVVDWQGDKESHQDTPNNYRLYRLLLINRRLLPDY
jgi:hypothetical protein